MQFKVAFIAVAYALTLQAEAESTRPHSLASFSPFAGRLRPMECLSEESPSNIQKGPRAELIGEVMERVEAEFKRVRSVSNPATPDDLLAQEMVNSNPAILRLFLRNNLTLKEGNELIKRWNDKYLHGAVKLPAEKSGYKNWLTKAFTDLYELPNLDDRLARFQNAIADEQNKRNLLIEQGVASGKPDSTAIAESIARSKGLVDALNELQSSMAVRAPAGKSVSDYLRRR